MTHTPTPWNWHGPYMTGAYKVSAMDAEDKLALRLYVEPSSNAEADAKFIVRACNAHDELVAALRCIDAALNQNKTFPADVELARAECRAALEKVNK